MKLMKATAWIFLLGSLAYVQQASADFRLGKVTYDVIPSNYGSTVVVYSNAVWRGKASPAWDHSWLTTFLNDSSQKADLKDIEAAFQGMRTYHYGWKNLTNGLMINCNDRECAASGFVPNCDNAKEDVTYLGHAKVGVNTFPPTTMGIKYGHPDEFQCKYTVGGTVSGLSSGESVVLTNNGGDPVTVGGQKGGSFTFPTPVASQTRYRVAIAEQPSSIKRCSVFPGTEEGVVESSDVTSVKVNCVTTCQATVSPVPAPGDLTAAGATHCKTPQLVDQDGFTVADYANNLLWTKDFVGSYAVFPDDARKACNDLVMSDRDDWRLPDIAQLQTLLPKCQGSMFNCDYRENPSGDRWAVKYWSSSIYVADPAGYGTCGGTYLCYWIAGFGEGWDYGLDYKRSTEANLTRCVTNLVP